MTILDTLLAPLWWNPNILPNSMYIKSWYKKGIKIVGDICNTDNAMKSHQHICEQFHVKPVDFISFHALNVSLKIFLRDQLDIIDHEPNTRPYYPKSLRLLLKKSKGTSNIGRVFNVDQTVFYNNKWSLDLNMELDKNIWRRAYQICFYTIQDNYLIYFQYGVLNRILGVKYLRKKMGLTASDICSLCRKDTETFLHLFCSCESSSKMWREISL